MPAGTFWLSGPTRFAGLGRKRARWALALIALLLAACLTALLVADPPALDAATGAEHGQTDLMLYETVIAGVAHGGNYYTVAADALRAGEYPLRPFLTFRLPGLAMLEALLPPLAVRLLLWALGMTVAAAWLVRLRPALPRRSARIAAVLCFAAGMYVFVQSDLAAFHEIWAGLLVALSLALRRPGRWVEAAAIGLIAMLIRETAALYVLVMFLFAWGEGARREALGWAGALVVFAAVLGVHAWAVAGVTGPLDTASPGWFGLQGFGFFVKSLALGTAVQFLPLWLAALLIGLALMGWSAWDSPLGARMTATFTAYAVVIAVFARLDSFYWGLMVAPLLLTGLVFVPDALGDLFHAAQGTRRRAPVTVTRVSR